MLPEKGGYTTEMGEYGPWYSVERINGLSLPKAKRANEMDYSLRKYQDCMDEWVSLRKELGR